ncbi:MAG: YcgN family cysteine cluster protein [Granulosicoccus sp.]
MSQQPFWETKTLEEMDDAEWESLCDGCGRCCMNKLEDEDTGDIVFTRVACKLLDTQTCRCSDYDNRFKHVPDCLTVKPLDTQKLTWLPETCAYRLLSEGRALEKWHPLLSGTKDSVLEADISMAHLCISETYVPVGDFFSHIVHWHDRETDS